MPSPAYRSGTSDIFDPGTTVTATKPAGVADGDLLVVLISIFHPVALSVSSVPSGWTLLPSAPLLTATNANRSYVYWKVAASEGASWAWGLSGSAYGAWACIAVSDPGGATPITDSQGALDAGGDTTADAPSVTTNATDNLLLYAHARNAGGSSASFAPPSGYTTRAWAHNTTIDALAYIATKAPAGVTGATGAIAGSQASYDSRASANYHIAVGAAAAPPPVAAFSGTPLTGDAPLTVAFTDASTNSPTSWAWTFGDGGTSTTQNPSHNYTTAGTYTVTLIATNTGGSDTETKTGYVVVAEPVVLPEGISLAPDDGALVANPTWERIDTTYNIQSWSIDRGRQNEMGRIDTGTARIELVDRTGDFDPTNPTGAFYGRLETGVPMGPLVQAAIALEDPVDETWSTLFRGFVSRLEWTPYRTLEHANVTLELVDGLALLAACEMAPHPGGFGDEIFEGNIVFHEDSELDAIQTRINQVLNQAQWPAELRSIYTGQVGLQQITYAPRSTALSVIQDAADATFPDIALVYVGGPRNPGEVVFRGRYARFHPDDAFYDLKNWQAGDDTSAATSPTTIVRVSPPLVASLDDTMVFTSAYATPNDPGGDMTTSDFDGQYVTDDLAVATYGLRTWSAENLATRNGADDTNALQETRLYADYVRDNMASPKVRVGQLTIKPRRPGSPGEGATWELLCNIDISDVVHLTTVHGVTMGGGGGFDHDFFVEGIHYQARPGGLNPYVELTLDVSPRGYYDSNPFES